jgi:predicted HTH domain antitoxin
MVIRIDRSPLDPPNAHRRARASQGRSREKAMATVTVKVPDGAFSALRRSPEEFAREMTSAAAIQWYHQGLISQGKAAEIAGLSRADFLDALIRARVPACQVTAEELKEELESWQHLSDGSSTPLP